MSFDTIPNGVSAVAEGSQSLSSRAMSFDQEEEHTPKIKEVSIPFEQGNVFRQTLFSNTTNTIRSQSLSSRAMSFD